jgi:hypothetical protein
MMADQKTRMTQDWEAGLEVARKGLADAKKAAGLAADADPEWVEKTIAEVARKIALFPEVPVSPNGSPNESHYKIAEASLDITYDADCAVEYARRMCRLLAIVRKRKDRWIDVTGDDVRSALREELEVDDPPQEQLPPARTARTTMETERSGGNVSLHKRRGRIQNSPPSG